MKRETNMRIAFRDAAPRAEWGPLRRIVKAWLRTSSGLTGGDRPLHIHTPASPRAVAARKTRSYVGPDRRKRR